MSELRNAKLKVKEAIEKTDCDKHVETLETFFK